MQESQVALEKNKSLKEQMYALWKAYTTAGILIPDVKRSMVYIAHKEYYNISILEIDYSLELAKLGYYKYGAIALLTSLNNSLKGFLVLTHKMKDQIFEAKYSYDIAEIRENVSKMLEIESIKYGDSKLMFHNRFVDILTSLEDYKLRP